MAREDRTDDGAHPLVRTEPQRRMLLALTDDCQSATDLAEVAGIPMKGAGTVLVALRERGEAERRNGGRFYLWRRAGSSAHEAAER